MTAHEELQSSLDPHKCGLEHVQKSDMSCRQHMLGDTKLVIGCPMISSAGNMKFWLYLCQASLEPAADTTVAPFRQAAAEGKEALAAYCQQYNTDLVHKVRPVDTLHICCLS